MTRKFTEFMFTDAVKEVQEMYGVRAGNARMEKSPVAFDRLEEREIEFITARDSFYMATVATTGWPYVQHRGGPKGFLKVLDDKTIAFGDFRGNDQFISVGNLSADDRISLIFMDYPNRRRVKVWGRVKVFHESDDLSLLAKMEVEGYDYPVYRAVVITIEAFDWNCPQHITPRFSEAEVNMILAEDFKELARYRASGGAVAALPNAEMAASLGEPVFPAKVISVTQRAEAINEIVLSLPKKQYFSPQAGSHIQVAVLGEGNKPKLNHYSLINAPGEEHVYRIAVQAELEGQGGSLFMHKVPHVGDILYVSEPRNEFPLRSDVKHSLLIAGGIGITPIYAMAQALSAQKTSFELHYTARSPERLAFVPELAALKAEFYVGSAGKKLQLEALLKTVIAGTHVYVCGPKSLIDAVIVLAEQLQIDRAQIHFELFGNPDSSKIDDKPVEVVLKQSGKTINVPAGKSILDAMLDAGIETSFSCKRGECGQCAVPVLEGTPDHRDIVLTAQEKKSGKVMCTCVSRAQGERLVLDA
jgi:ferredoxin-NADP reductase/predicted pyridoxine 5'-phosphate oxidase superfamily flavin-nucleotide-binding protein